nr:energy transducer TonB [Caenimonas soli]
MPVSSYLPVRQLNRNIVIGGSVVLFHVAALWALQSGLLRRAVEIVVPVAILSDIVTPPMPKAEPVPQPPVPKPPEPVKPVVRKVERAQPPTPQPVAVPSPAPAPQAPTGVETQAPVAPAAPAVTAASPAPSPAPAKVELPSSDADYLRNPAPSYPPMSKRLGEQGKVLVRVLIGADGTPQKAELKRSSGFDRLDRAALEYVMKCRYVPGKVAGVPQAMWHEAPVNFVLE